MKTEIKHNPWYNPLLLVLIFVSFWERFNVYVGFSLNAGLILVPFYFLWLAITVYQKKSYSLPALPKPYLLVIGCILLTELVSSFGSLFPQKVLSVTIFQLIKFLIMLAVVSAATTTKYFQRIKNTWIVGTTTVALLALYQFIVYKLSISPTLPLETLLHSLGLPMNTLPADHFTFPLGSILFIRPSSTFIDTNTAAGFLATSMILLLGALWRKKEKKLLLWTELSLLIIHFSAFSLMLSRSAWLGFLITLITGGILVYKKQVRFVLSRQVLIGLVVISILPFIFFMIRLGQSLALIDLSSLGHIEFARGAIQLWLKQPLFGVGAGTFEQSYLQLINPLLTNAYSHSMYLQWLAETGLFGLAAQLFFIYLILKSTLVTKQQLLVQSRDDYIERIGLWCAFLVLVIANIFYAYYSLIPTYILLGMLLGKTVSKK